MDKRNNDIANAQSPLSWKIVVLNVDCFFWNISLSQKLSIEIHIIRLNLIKLTAYYCDRWTSEIRQK